MYIRCFRHIVLIKFLRRSCSLQRFVFTGQQHRSSLIGHRSGAIAIGTVGNNGVGLWDKQLLFCCGELAVVPIADGIVKPVLDITKFYLVVLTEFCLCLIGIDRIVSIVVRHHVQQRHLTVRSRSDGQRDADSLAESVRTACIGRDILVVNIDSTLDEPVVGRYGTFAHLILATNIITVVDNGLRAVYEVT